MDSYSSLVKQSDLYYVTLIEQSDVKSKPCVTLIEQSGNQKGYPGEGFSIACHALAIASAATELT